MNSREISIDGLKEVFEDGSWKTIKIFLDTHVAQENLHELVAPALLKAGKLIYRRPEPRKEKRREEFFEEILKFVSAAQQDAVSRAIKKLRLIEAGYREILAGMERAGSAAMDPAKKVQGVIDIVFQQAGTAIKRAREAISEAGTVSNKVTNPDGVVVDVDGLLERCAEAVGMTVAMEGHRQSWKAEDGIYVVPKGDVLSESEAPLAQHVFKSAIVWSRWQDTESRARLLGGSLESVQAGGRTRVEHHPNLEIVRHSLVASERLQYKMMQLQGFFGESLMERTRSQEGFSPKDSYFIEVQLAIATLSDILARDVENDKVEYQSLTLKQWVKCYAAIKCYAPIARRSNITRTRSGWEHVFSEYGIPSSTASHFIKATTFGAKSRDMYDHPFLRYSDGTLFLLAPILIPANISRLVLSSLSAAEMDLSEKGKHFEYRVLEIFESNGIAGIDVKRTINDEDYELDAIVPWGDYIFLFECKNKNLPYGSPIAICNFEEDCEEAIKQIKRQVDGLKRYPEILLKGISVPGDTRKIVPVVLNCLPYARPGARDGVYFYDAQSLERFFGSATIDMRSGPSDDDVRAGFPQFRIWEGERPTADDLLAQLEAPVAFSVINERVQITEQPYPLGDSWEVHETDLFMSGYEGLVLLEKKGATAALGTPARTEQV